MHFCDWLCLRCCFAVLCVTFRYVCTDILIRGSEPKLRHTSRYVPGSQPRPHAPSWHQARSQDCCSAHLVFRVGLHNQMCLLLAYNLSTACLHLICNLSKPCPPVRIHPSIRILIIPKVFVLVLVIWFLHCVGRTIRTCFHDPYWLKQCSCWDCRHAYILLASIMALSAII